VRGYIHKAVKIKVNKNFVLTNITYNIKNLTEVLSIILIIILKTNKNKNKSKLF